MKEIMLLAFVLVSCAFSFIVGKIVNEKKKLEKEIKAVSLGSSAGESAVRAFKLRKNK